MSCQLRYTGAAGFLFFVAPTDSCVKYSSTTGILQGAIEATQRSAGMFDQTQVTIDTVGLLCGMLALWIQGVLFQILQTK